MCKQMCDWCCRSLAQVPNRHLVGCPLPAYIYIYAPLGHTLKSIGGKYSKSHGAYGIDFEFGECIDFAQKGGGES